MHDVHIFSISIHGNRMETGWNRQNRLPAVAVTGTYFGTYSVVTSSSTFGFVISEDLWLENIIAVKILYIRFGSLGHAWQSQQRSVDSIAQLLSRSGQLHRHAFADILFVRFHVEVVFFLIASHTSWPADDKLRSGSLQVVFSTHRNIIGTRKESFGAPGLASMMSLAPKNLKQYCLDINFMGERSLAAYWSRLISLWIGPPQKGIERYGESLLSKSFTETWIEYLWMKKNALSHLETWWACAQLCRPRSHGLKVASGT